MVLFTLRLPPYMAAALIALLTTWVMRTRPKPEPDGVWPTAVQQQERDKNCIDCGRGELLEYDHVPDYELTGHTVTGELRLRCAPCHHRRHGRKR